MAKAKKKFLDMISYKATKIAGFISATLVIIGALTGAVTWLNGQVQAAITAQVSSLKMTMENSDKQQNQQITRLELMELINNQPNNTAEIEKVARYYFQELGGNWYMTSLYSTWCSEHGGDPSIAGGR